MMNIRAYAKINIGLHVLGKRPDGYHDIETIFRLINMYDELEFVQADEGIAFSTDNRLLVNDNTNLCVRAANLLRDLTGTHAGVEITLKKRIPLGAGLGGGSSDAAAVLKGLAKLWALDISIEELQTISATLGSDVPFFFSSQTAFAAGRGEQLTPMALHIPYWILTLTPEIHVSTAWAYANVRLRQATNRPNLKELLVASMDNPEALRTSLVNDFEESVFRDFSNIARLKDLLLKEGAEVALMSGSGSSVFGFFSSEEKAMRLSSELSNRYFVSITGPQFQPEIN
jgi:4-diphosphocytidyl-2-C-methyl-D-erythritol kinase